MKLLYTGCNILVSVFNGRNKVIVKCVVYLCRCRYNTAKVLVYHGNCSVNKVAESVYKVAVKFCNKHFVGNRAVTKVRHFRKSVVSHTICTNKVCKIVGVHYISSGLAHFVHARQKPWVTENLFGHRLTESHKNYRPVNCVETKNVLSYNLKVGRPVLFVKLTAFIYIIADSRYVVDESVHPYINNVTGVKFYRNTPLECGTRYTKVLNTGLYEVVYHFLFSGFRNDEVGMGVKILL